MLAARIDSEIKDAARAQDKRRLGTLRMLKSAMKYREIETGKPLEDAEILQVVGTLIKQRRDSVAQYTAGGRSWRRRRARRSRSSRSTCRRS